VKQELNFTAEALAGIFLGKISRWNDPEMARANPGVALPVNGIVVVHRSDGSGTTFVWTDYLSKASAAWKSQVGAGNAVKWPVGLGAKGNEGVAGIVKQTPNSIGYVELVYAIQNKMPYGKVRNAAGVFVKAGLNSVTAAAASATMPDDFRVSITNRRARTPTRFRASPGCWCGQGPGCAEAQDHHGFPALDARRRAEDGQPLGYAPLPNAVIVKELKAVSQVQ